MFDHRGQTLHAWGKDATGLITYTLNNQGFRSNYDYKESAKYAFFGCSTLFGIGINLEDTLVSQLNGQNYGIAGEYVNQDSIINLENFLKSKLYDNTRVVFFWVERPGEDIVELSRYVDSLAPRIIQISQGPRYSGLLNLPPQVDVDVSGTHPGPRTQKIWAKVIKAIFKNES
jgi:hypothetical protein